MRTGNKRFIALLVLSSFLFMIAAPAIAQRPEHKNEATRYFEEWKRAYNEGRYSESIPLIEEAIRLDPAYRDAARSYLKKTKEKIAFKRTDMDPLLKRKIAQERYLKRMAAVKKAFDIEITEEFMFDSNPFRMRDDVKNDFIISTVPRFAAHLSDPDSGLELLDINYMFYYYKYTKHPDQDRFDHYFNFDFKLPKLIQIAGKKIRIDVHEFLHPGTYYASSEDRSFRKVIANETWGEVFYPISPKTSVGMKYKHELEYYLQKEYYDFSYQKNHVTPSFYYHVTPKTSIFGGYSFSVITYTTGGTYDSNSNTIRAGVLGQLTPKSSVRATTSYEFRNYHDHPYNKGTDRWLFNFIYTNRLSSKMTLSAFLNRSIQESTYVPNPYFIDTKGGVRWNQQLTPKIGLTFKAALMHMKYPKNMIVDSTNTTLKRRRDLRYNVSGALDYNVTGWLSAGIKYHMINNTSNVSSEEYLDQTFTTSIRAHY